MLELYFSYRAVLRRLRSGALGGEMDCIAARFSELGYKRASAKIYLSRIARFSHFAAKRGGSAPISQEVVDRYLLSFPTESPRIAVVSALAHARRVAPERFIVPVSAPVDDPEAPLLSSYQDYLRKVRGLEPKSCEGILLGARRFLDWFRHQYPDKGLEAVTAEHVLAAVEDQLSRSVAAGTRTSATSHIRAFLRFLHWDGRHNQDLARVVPGTPHWRLAHLPPRLTWEEVRRAIDLIGVTTPGDKRLVFRNICAYTAIALANAANFQLLTASHQELIAAQQELERVANCDALTGLATRRHFTTVANAEIARAIRFNHPLVVLIFDIDHFKLVNDRYGHLVGDVALTTIARLLEQGLRPSDLIARYGGEEFVALLPETDGPAALITAERLRKLVEAAKIETGGHGFRVTVSVGVARWQAPEPTIEAALARADQALYRVKESGRNGVMFDPAAPRADDQNGSHISRR